MNPLNLLDSSHGARMDSSTMPFTVVLGTAHTAVRYTNMNGIVDEYLSWGPHIQHAR